MPLRKYSRRTSRPYRAPMNRPYRRRRMTTGKVKRIVGAELKLRVTGNDFLDVSVAAPLLTEITNGIPLGDTSTTRTGNWIRPIIFHGYMTAKGFNGAAVEQYGIRLSIIRWNEDEANNAITAGKVYSDVAAPAGPFSVVNTGAFKVVWTRYFIVVNDINNTKFTQTRKFYARLLGAPKITYTGANPKKYHYHVIATSDDISVAEHPQMQIDAIFRFNDS